MFESTVVCGHVALVIQGEHHARKVSFAETAIWKERFGEGTFELLHQRNCDNAPYPIDMTIENDVPYWYVTKADTAIAGAGKCELRYVANHIVIKSCTFITDVIPSLVEASGEVPEPEQAWVDQVLNAAQEVKDAVTHNPIIGDNGNWFVWDSEKGEYVDTGISCSGGSSGNIPTKLSDLTNDKGFITSKDISAVYEFANYDSFYVGMIGGYENASNWLRGQIIRIKNSSVPLLYMSGTDSTHSIPHSEEECVQLLATTGKISGNGVAMRK